MNRFFNLPTRASHSIFKSRYYPSPIFTNLHWVYKQNYQFRVYGKGKPDKRWTRGCEQHFGFTYLMELLDKDKTLKLEFNQKETTDIGWFSLGELEKLNDLNPEIKWELQQAFKIGIDE